jgi:dTDP-4-dehydrorhamnose reductase
MAVARPTSSQPPDTAAHPRVLVIGAQGVLGTFLARGFAEAAWEVVRGGRRAEAATDFRQLDLDAPDTVRRASADVDLIVRALADVDASVSTSRH